MANLTEKIKAWVHKFVKVSEAKTEMKFKAFADGYSYGYDLYLVMRRKHPGKNERATLTNLHISNTLFKPWFIDAWLDGLREGWSDADGDWLTTFSVKEMERARNEYSIKEEREMIRAKFDELYS